MKNERDTNIELLRIVSMMIIILHHYVVNSGLLDVGGPIMNNPTGYKSLILLVLGWGGKTGINCFIFITGYFMCKSKIKIEKFWKLLLEIEFYKVGIYVLLCLFGCTEFSKRGVFNAIVPVSNISDGFSSCFLIFYLFIPFINIIIHAMTERQHLLLILLCCFMFVLFETMPFFYINFNYVEWFIVLFLVAAYIRLYPKNIFNNMHFWLYAMILSLIISWLSVLILVYKGAMVGGGIVPYKYVSDSNNLLAFSCGLAIFMFFKNLNVGYSFYINKLAESTFGVLMIHANSDAMRKWLWRDLLKNVDFYYSKYMLLHVTLSVWGIYIICTFVDQLRIICLEKPLFKRIKFDKVRDIIGFYK